MSKHNPKQIEENNIRLEINWNQRNNREKLMKIKAGLWKD